MADTLSYLNDESIARELVVKTKGCGLFWKQTSPDSFVSTSFEEKSTGVVVLWEFSLYKTNTQFNLDISRNMDYYTSVKSDILSDLYDLLFTINGTNSDNKQNVLNFIQNTPTCNIPLQLPFKLKPNSDITPISTGWKRVPANGYRYEKIREDVAIHDGDATFIYDDSNSQVKLGFDPVPANGPEEYGIISVDIAVKNVSGSPTLDGQLLIEVPNQTVISMPFVSGTLDPTYQIVNWTWTDSFTKEQINYLRIQFNSIPGVNRVTAIQANVDVPS